jgi:hypothetical protein
MCQGFRRRRLAVVRMVETPSRAKAAPPPITRRRPRLRRQVVALSVASTAMPLANRRVLDLNRRARRLHLVIRRHHHPDQEGLTPHRHQVLLPHRETQAAVAADLSLGQQLWRPILAPRRKWCRKTLTSASGGITFSYPMTIQLIND